ncbi:hypothetical protein GF406_00880 [candidate division KSB1 bacterium]|nr:hypothetical protein [candidate division KSB1 bacterium]
MMKQLVQISIMIVFACTTIVLPQQYDFELTVQNQSALGSTLSFDIYMVRTGTDEIHLGNSNFVLTFASENFTNPVASYGSAADRIARCIKFFRIVLFYHQNLQGGSTLHSPSSI